MAPTDFSSCQPIDGLPWDAGRCTTIPDLNHEKHEVHESVRFKIVREIRGFRG
jgi:hypothetical protein